MGLRLGVKLACGALLAGLLSACASSPPTTGGDAITARDMRAHMTFLAADALQGREAGTPGYDVAAAYVASQFAAAGLAPGGVDGAYFQPVPLLSFQRDNAGALFEVQTRQGVKTLTLGDEYYVSGSPDFTESSVRAPVVFAGFGVVAPQYGHDDYAAVDVEGKIVAVLAGAPNVFQTEERAHFASGRSKAAEASKRGAVGLITLYTPERQARFNFARAMRSSGNVRMTWVAPEAGGDAREGADAAAETGPPPLQLTAVMSMDGARALFVDAPFSFDAVLGALEDEGEPLPRGALNVAARLSQRSTHERIASANVVGVLPGSDPVLRDEHVVLTAHLDHLGLGPAFQADRIFNGAMDNAAGVSALLEVAAAARQTRLARTVVFVALTAEEKGLVGAEYFTHHPPFDEPMVANINLDMPVLLYDFTDVIAFGAERSTLGPIVAAAAAAVDVELAPDPMPEQGLFTRSDHYRFVQKGVPSVFLMTGFSNGGREAFTTFLATRYHNYDDDLEAPINYEAGAKFAVVNYAIMVETANTPMRPVWRDGDFFATLYGGETQSDLDAP